MTITNFLAERSCGPLQGRSSHEFSGRAFWWATARAEVTDFLAEPSCGPLCGGSNHEFSCRALLRTAVGVALPRIFWQRILVGRCKGGAVTNFLAERFIRLL